MKTILILEDNDERIAGFRSAVEKLEGICSELKTLKNRGKLLGTYGC